MIRATLIATIVFTAAPALATGGIYCDGAVDPTISAYLTVGRVPGFAVVGARIDAAGQAWDMNATDGATEIALAQGAVVGDLIVADFSDPNAEKIIVSLRVVHATNDVSAAAAGTLSIPGVGAWPMICEID